MISKVKPFDKKFNVFFTGFLFYSLMIIGLSFVQPIISQRYIDHALSNLSVSILAELLIAMLGTAIINVAFHMIRNQLEQWEYTKLRMQIQENVLSKLLRSNGNRGIGDAEDIMESEIYYFVLKSFTLNKIVTSFLIFGSVAVMAYIDCRLLFAAIIIIPTTKWLLFLTNKRLTAISQDYRKKYIQYESWMVSILNNWQAIKVGSGEEAIMNRYHQFWDDLSILYRKRQKAFILQYCINQFKNVVMVRIGLYLLGVWFIASGSLSVGYLMAFIQYYDYLTNAVEDNIRYSSEENSYNAYIESVDRLLDEKMEQKPYCTPNMETPPDILLKNIKYMVDGIKLIDIPFLQIKCNDTVLLRGESGKGKTTLLHLIAGLIPDYEGDISIGGVNIRELSPENLAVIRGMAAQDNKLFRLSIRENMKLAKADVTEEEMIACCLKAGCAEFLEQLPKGLDTPVDSNLSAGQVQRLCIARIILQDPAIVLLDEPTSALDAGHEAKIKSVIETKWNNHAVVIASHSIDSIGNAQTYALC